MPLIKYYFIGTDTNVSTRWMTCYTVYLSPTSITCQLILIRFCEYSFFTPTAVTHSTQLPFRRHFHKLHVSATRVNSSGMTAEDKADRYRVLDEPIRLTALADRVRTAVEEFDQLIGVNTPDEQSQLRKWIKRCKVKTAANTTKQQFTNAGLLVLMRQHYETVQGSDISYMPSGSSYLDTATAPVSNSLTSHFNTILGEMYQSPLDVYK
ncbi:hypothetical protein BDF19DRAFT_287663 [Syncephalis fuscata]|nr:hypothetical protein BDF19DRAFT_287663 [Syncephalis fuscata]